ncbi:Ppx/GppA phosphatase family protein [Pelomonas sp. SE-A7]|uniref:Ppx/GppA phosphatase family protein n=1 Tax=Pelomonas sp. SE-A7 TaxID=3054953 RepID=UPI00259CCD5C|nr:Ppx/GppA phosphatase family protein [Pelomonas sp. SE-A7]MDM4767238.1 Ppx/GppA phosphatase family protein [Pelomonas sp. SE-A7]
MNAVSSLPLPLAAIDMGSNSFRLEIAQVAGSQYKRQQYLKETVRLGGGLDADGLLTEEAMQRGLDCLARFKTALSGFAPERVRAVATQTLREARNRNAFLVRAEQALGYPVEVISGREEARLIFGGVARLQPSEHTRLVIDIGGRSTEMILGRGRQPLKAESFQIGSVSLSMRFFPEGRFTAEAFRAAQIAAGAELEEAFKQFSRQHSQPAWTEALGSSGTVGAVAQLLAGSGITDGTVTPEALRWCMEQCLAAGHMDKLALPGLKDDRRAVVAGGLCILYTLLTQFGIEALKPAKGALRQGVVFELAQRLQPSGRMAEDLREQSVQELQRRFLVDTEQARRVRDQALGFLRQLQPKSPPELRRELAWAADLHEIGMMVSHHDHHRHSAYLLSHVDAAGFSQNQLQRLGDLALGQRGGLRKLGERLEDESFVAQLLALRLAVLQCHGRGAQAGAGLSLQRDERRVRVKATPAWTQANPRSAYLLLEELQAWQRGGPLNLVTAE